VYNLYQAIGELGADPVVYRNDGITMEEVRQLAPDAIVLSPGPGHPANARDFGVCRNILEEVSPTTPTLGVCLGHQGIGTAYGGKVGHAVRILHGEDKPGPTRWPHDLRGSSNPITAGRYHSLAIDRESFAAGARTEAPPPTKARSWPSGTGAIRSKAFSSIRVEFSHPKGRRSSANF